MYVQTNQIKIIILEYFLSRFSQQTSFSRTEDVLMFAGAIRSQFLSIADTLYMINLTVPQTFIQFSKQRQDYLKCHNMNSKSKHSSVCEHRVTVRISGSYKQEHRQICAQENALNVINKHCNAIWQRMLNLTNYIILYCFA